MATASKTKSRTPIQRARVSASSSHIVPVAQPARHHLCQSCNALPAGSMQLIALLLVLVFSLSAVLFTSVYALNSANAEVRALTTHR